MKTKEPSHDEILDRLNQTVLAAAAYFATADERHSDGRDTAFGILAQLAFWHQHYVLTAQALLEGRAPELESGSFQRLNQIAHNQFAGHAMTMMAYDLSCAQKELDRLVRELPDWSVNFPIKADSEPRSVAERLQEIEAHIRQHVNRLQRVP